ILLVLNLPLVGVWASILRLPTAYLCTGTLVFCIVGAYSLRGSPVDVGVMVLFGAIGYALRKLDMPLAPAVLALILGPFMEKSLRTSLAISGGDFSVFFTRPLSATLIFASAVILVVSTLRISTVKAIKAAESA